MRNLEILDGAFLRAPDYVNARALAANTAEAVAVPAGASHVVFSGNCDFHARYNAALSGTAAAVPGDTTDGTACELNPAARYIGIGQVAEISIISTAGGIVTLAFYGPR